MAINRYKNWIQLFGILLLASTASPQTTGKISGRVTDADTGEPLPGANVLVEGTTLGAATGLDGGFIILRVPPGKHTVRVDYIGYQRQVMQELEVLTDLTSKADFKLKSQTVELGEEVVVVAERPLIRKDLTSAESRVQSEEISRLAVQDVGDVINLQAGITRDAGGGLHIRGGRSTEVAYVVDGIRITDDFTRTQSLQVENESVQELQVISGTFNAEYGQAMSGIINIVTKGGTNDWHGNFETWAGDYASSRDEVFWDIDDLSPAANYNLQGSLSGPILKDRLTFFATARRWNNDGFVYGPRAYIPQMQYAGVSGDSLVAVPADSSPVSMNYRRRWSGQGTLDLRISGPMRLKLSALGSTEDSRKYDEEGKHRFRLNPEGDRGDEEYGVTAFANFTHTLGTRTFYEAKLAHKYNELTSRLYQNFNDPRYVDPRALNTGTAQQFYQGGTDLDRFKRYTKSWIGKFDLTSQVDNRNQVKAGLEVQFDQVFLEDITLVPALDANGQQIIPFQPAIEDISSSNNDQLTREPFSFAAYFQDKIEYESLIINVGLRFDYFDPKGKIPVDLEDPNIYNPFKDQNIYRDLNGDGVIDTSERTEANKKTVEERRAYWYRDTEVKYQFSPRLGVAYPITDRGVIHFSYGIFQQVPDYEQLYRGDEIKITNALGIQGPYGNPDLKPQRTTMYELGVQQQLSENIGIDVTGFYRDIRNWVSAGAATPTAVAGVSYGRKINRDFANVRGLTFAANQRFSSRFSFSMDYTFQVVEGTNSTPEEEFFSQRDGGQPTQSLTPLDWDQRHALNATMFLGGKEWGVSGVARFNSGQPYTPSLTVGTTSGQGIVSGLLQNSREKPNRFSVDLSGFKDFKLATLNLQVFGRVFNLFDASNPVNVFADTGTPDAVLFEAPGASPTYYLRPDFYSAPREVQVGFKVGF
ncbi:MAG: TonB-dependent receptor [bacterium]